MTALRNGNKGQFQKGRVKTGGRRKGTPNRATRAVKDFLSEIQDCADAYGRPRQTLGLSQGQFRMIHWPDGEDVAEE